MKKLYFENQLFLTWVALIGLSIASFYYYQNIKMINDNIVEKKAIMRKEFRGSQRKSTFFIDVN